MSDQNGTGGTAGAAPGTPSTPGPGGAATARTERFFLDVRTGCAAIRDRLHTEPAYPGLHSDTSGVVEYVGAERTADGFEFEAGAIDRLRQRTAHLNRRQRLVAASEEMYSVLRAMASSTALDGRPTQAQLDRARAVLDVVNALSTTGGAA